MVTPDDIRTVALSLPRTEEALVRDQVKFRVGRIVYVALSRDELSMGFGFPKDERAALVAAHPGKFFMPTQSDLRYNWVRVWLESIDQTEMRELVVDAWRMVVPKRVAAEYLGDHPERTTQTPLLTYHRARAMRRAGCALRFLVVLEGQLDLRAVDELAAVPDVNVLLDDLGDPKVPDRMARRFDRVSGSLLPGGRARADDVDHAVDAHSCPPRWMCRSPSAG